MYHINHEGKIYPCRAKLLACPYGNDMHAETREELYYKLLAIDREVDVPIAIKNEISAIGRLKSLSSISKILETTPHPIETIIVSLEYAIRNQLTPNKLNLVEGKWNRFIEDAAEDVYENLQYGLPIPPYVSAEVKRRGEQIFEERLDSRVIEYAGATRNISGLKKRRLLDRRIGEFEAYKNFKKYGLTERNFEANLQWLQKDFKTFSEHLNYSKMLTRPVFFLKTVEEAEEEIKKLNNYELLSAYDDYLITITEARNAASTLRYFKDRPDLSDAANANIRKWYDRNAKIAAVWADSTPKSILISMKMAEELDRRGVKRQDNIIGLHSSSVKKDGKNNG